MIVCLCHGVNDRALDKIIDAGARSVREIGDACGAGTDCGQCCSAVRHALKQRRGCASVDQGMESAPRSK